MLKARRGSEGLRKFIHRVNILNKGLYPDLRRLNDSPAAYLYGTKQIISRLYGGNETAALAAADTALGVTRS